ncbi:MAG: family 78 glycoside hydrolase catalytic domain [Clostridia bacterium]|nr:family 78 glycoside hydrolase catalytic domain [Clostridia bacterium]
MKINAKWITSPTDTGMAPVIFRREWTLQKEIKKATLCASAIGLYEARINGVRVGNDLFTPGWTTYWARTQYQTYDVTDLMTDEICIDIAVGSGWAVGSLAGATRKRFADYTSLIACLDLTYTDGTSEQIATDTDWAVFTSKILYSELYHGETVDMTATEKPLGKAVLSDVSTKLIPNEGAFVREQERIAPIELIRTPAGETVLDFGQNLTGYVEVCITAPRGSRVSLHHAEVLDADGNFYTENMRSAKNEILYVCSGARDTFKPTFSFQGFRYVRVMEYPFEKIDLAAFTAVVVHSEMERTGDFVCGNEKINQLYHNIIWGQKSNYLDVPTDCPQRDERLGWTGDAQVFCRTAAINYDVEQFFNKWLGDVRADQLADGSVPSVVPNCFRPRDRVPKTDRASAAWADCACVIPWELYRAYGNKSILKKNFNLMKKWVERMHADGPEEFLRLGEWHYGDWLGMDDGPDSYIGATPMDLIASAYFAYSTALLVKAGEALGRDMTKYRTLYENVVKAFRDYFLPDGKLFLRPDLNTERGKQNPPAETQTAYALILYFGLCEERDRQYCADRLAALIRENDGLMTTGFVGTPYLLHALSENGYTELAYDLLFEERNPSWLYSVNHGATTMWEHWNGIKDDGSFWSKNMNSFNHYAYGAVYDWIFGKAVGINTVESAPGYREITITPHPDRRLGFAKASIRTRTGEIMAHWYYKGDVVYYEFEIPAGVTAHLTLPSGRTATLVGGTYLMSE